MRMHGRWAIAGAAAGLVAAACATGGLRPRYGAVPKSVLLILPDSADTTIVQLTARVRELGLTVVRSVPREGYLETGWYDADLKQPTGEPYARLDRVVKLRFFADPSQGRTRLLAECVRRIAWDPSMPPHDLERMVPDDHPGRALLDSVLTVVHPIVPDTTHADTTHAAPRPGAPRPNAPLSDTTHPAVPRP